MKVPRYFMKYQKTLATYLLRWSNSGLVDAEPGAGPFEEPYGSVILKTAQSHGSQGCCDS